MYTYLLLFVNGIAMEQDKVVERSKWISKDEKPMWRREKSMQKSIKVNKEPRFFR